MNERIKELALQADKLSLQYANKNNINFVDAFNIVFAKLLIQECANAIVNDSRLNDVRSAANGCVRTIKEHFGVEE